MGVYIRKSGLEHSASISKQCSSGQELVLERSHKMVPVLGKDGSVNHLTSHYDCVAAVRQAGRQAPDYSFSVASGWVPASQGPWDGWMGWSGPGCCSRDHRHPVAVAVECIIVIKDGTGTQRKTEHYM
ncbi:hypothetical protein U9M48_007616 [Paspalum notatum var. saurae]|uniref:Uncharacterized protein n=1 Tax=Paspalum notatum var. saurae TaxID=547442 RepID=A0AAQ3WC46_PASNO